MPDRLLAIGTVLLVVLLVTNAQGAFGDVIGNPAYELAGLLVVGRLVQAIRSGFDLRRTLRRSKELAAVIALFASYGAFVLFADVFGVAAPRPGSFPEIWLKDMVIVAALVLGARSVRRVRFFSWLIVGSIIVLAGPALIQHLTGTYDSQWGGLATNESGFIDGQERVQIGGPLGGANPLAQWLVTALPLALHFMVSGLSRVRRVFAGLMAILAIAGVIATQSRQGLLVMLLLAVVWVAFYSRPSKRALLRGGVVALVVLALVVGSNPSRWGRQVERLGEASALFGADIDPESSAAGYAGTFWAGYDMFLDHPIGGVGHGNFTERYPEYVELRGIDASGKARSAHNVGIHLLAESGIFGATLFSAGFLGVMWVLRTARGRLRAFEMTQDSKLATSLRICLIIWAASALFQGLFHTEQLIVVIGVALGLGRASDGLRPEAYT